MNGKFYDYFCWIEPHKSGYPHIHLYVFTSEFLITHKELCDIWNKKFGVGKVVFLKRYWNWNKDKKGIYYALKYCRKYYLLIPKILKSLNGDLNNEKEIERYIRYGLLYATLWIFNLKSYSISLDKNIPFLKFQFRSKREHIGALPSLYSYMAYHTIYNIVIEKEIEIENKREEKENKKTKKSIWVFWAVVYSKIEFKNFIRYYNVIFETPLDEYLYFHYKERYYSLSIPYEDFLNIAVNFGIPKEKVIELKQKFECDNNE